MRRPAHSTRLARMVGMGALAGVVVGSCALGGCYRHVVSERGVAAGRSGNRIHEPNYKKYEDANALDRAADRLLGKQPKKK